MAKLAKRLRYEVLRRDGFRCRYCGAEPGQSALQIDHVVPEALGGTNEPGNLVTSCEPCNSGKTSTTPDAPLVDEVAEGALRWAGAMQAAAALKEKEIAARRTRNDWFLEIWNDYKFGDGKTVPLPADWSEAVTRLETSGLTYLLFEDAVEVAMKAHKVQAENRFRYLCGVAWNMVTELQQKAQQIASGAMPEEEETYYSGMDRDAVGDVLATFENITEEFMKRVPVWAHEGAERLARDDFYNAGEPDAARVEVLPHVLRHVGSILSQCNIEPAPGVE